MGLDDDLFATVDVSELRAGDGLKWHRYDESVIPAWIADMDVAMCPEIADAISTHLAAARRSGSIGYPGDEVTSSVARAFARRSFERHGWQPEPERVRLASDIVGALTSAVERLTSPGDAVVVQTPVYPPFLEQLVAMGRRVIHHEGDCSQGSWRWSVAELESLVDDRLRMLVLVNPHNPTGHVADRADLLALAEFAERHDLVVIADEVHADLVLDDVVHVPFASVGAAAAARTITLTSAGKAFNLAGMRCCIVHVGSDALLARFDTLPHSLAGSVSTPAMWATLAAWEHGDPWLESVLDSLRQRRSTLVEFLAEHLPEVGYLPGQATYLAWLDFGDLGLGDEPADFFESRARVALGTGVAYGRQGRGFARLNFATSDAVLREVLERMVTAVDIEMASR